MTTQTHVPTVARDARVDQIGFANELAKQHIDGLKDAVKTRMLDGEVQLVEGDFFQGLLVAGGTVGTICPRKFHRLLKQGKITEDQFHACISVQRKPAEQYCSGKELDRMSEFKPASPRLVVSRKKGVEPSLVDAIRGLSKAIAE